MTPEEINNTNRQIAEWLDKDAQKTCTRCFYRASKTPCTFGCNEYEPPDYIHTNAAFGLLDVLVERGYWYQLNGVLNNYSCEIGIEPGVEIFRSLVQPTKSAAICKAVWEVIRREKR